MASVSDFRNGMAIRHNGEIWIVTDFQHVKPGKGQAFIRTKLKQLTTGKVIDHTFRLSDTIEEVRLEQRPMQFLYTTGDELHLMDTETFDQIMIPRELLGDQAQFLKEGHTVNVMFLESRPVTASLPTFIELEVTSAPPGVKGDTVSNLQKPATLETGAEIQVPLFIKQGDMVKIDTRDGSYIERVSK